MLKWARFDFAPDAHCVTHAERDKTGICYEVRYETFDQCVTLWHRRVQFGMHESNVAGGRFFVMAAQDQASAAETAVAYWEGL